MTGLSPTFTLAARAAFAAKLHELGLIPVYRHGRTSGSPDERECERLTAAQAVFAEHYAQGRREPCALCAAVQPLGPEKESSNA